MILESILLMSMGLTSAFFILWGFEKATKIRFRFFPIVLIILSIICMLSLVSNSFNNMNEGGTFEEQIFVYAFWFAYIAISFVIGYIGGLIEKRFGDVAVA